MAERIIPDEPFAEAAALRTDKAGFAFIHLTDVHLGYGPSYVGGEYKKGDDSLTSTFCQQIWSWMEVGQIDFALVSGDIADTGEQKNINKAKDFIWGFENLDSRQKYTTWPLPFSEQNVAFMPGNHDRFRSNFHGRMPTSNVFNTEFSKVWPIGQWVVTAEATPNDSIRRVFFVMVDFTLERSEFSGGDLEWIKFRKNKIPEGMPIGSLEQWGAHLGQGEVYDARLKDLVDKTTSLRTEVPDAEIYWVVHYPPYFPDITGSMCLIGEEKLSQAAEDAAITIIFSGHTHLFKDYTLNNAVSTKIICSPALSKVSNKGEQTGFRVCVADLRPSAPEKIKSYNFIYSRKYRRYVRWTA